METELLGNYLHFNVKVMSRSLALQVTKDKYLLATSRECHNISLRYETIIVFAWRTSQYTICWKKNDQQQTIIYLKYNSFLLNSQYDIYLFMSK